MHLAKVAEILKKSEKLNLTDWNAMNIATVSAKNVPSSRMVLLKKINDDGLVFYTNFNSKKGQDLTGNKFVAVNFNLPLSVAIRTFCVSGIVDLVATALLTIAKPFLRFD